MREPHRINTLIIAVLVWSALPFAIIVNAGGPAFLDSPVTPQDCSLLESLDSDLGFDPSAFVVRDGGSRMVFAPPWSRNKFSGTFDVMLNAIPEAENCTLPLFAPAKNVRVSIADYAGWVAVDDFNRDGRPDMAVTTSEPRFVVIYLGDGMGGFEASGFLQTPNYAAAIETGDFNRDGNVDLAVGGRLGVYIFLGDGSGGFAPPTTYPSGGDGVGGGFAIAVSDFNQDGKLDLAVGHNTTGLGILLGDGDGGFSPPTEYLPGAGPQSISVADFNDDGKADLITGNPQIGNVSILIGDGTGAFTVNNLAIPATEITGQFGIDDFNGDSKLDLVVGDPSPQLMLGDGQGGFGASSSIPTSISGRSSIRAADLTGDGETDLAVYLSPGTYWDPHNILILEGNGSGQFSEIAELEVEDGRYGTHQFLIEDVNSDGRPDILVPNRHNRTVSIFLNNGMGSLDVTAPTIRMTNNIAEATGPQGAQVFYEVSATDDGGNVNTVSCDIPSGTTFPIGTTQVACTASDFCGNFGTALLTVTVTDAPPVLDLPSEIAVTSASPQVVNYTATASDTVSGSLSIDCLPASGTSFNVGLTIVNCSATDGAGNTTNGSFIVNVGPVSMARSGDIDASFNASPPLYGDFPGVVTEQSGSASRAMVLQPDGKILTGGNDSGGGFSINRFNADGSPDLTFGENGKTSGLFPEDSVATVMSLALQQVTTQTGVETKIIAAGETGYNLSLWDGLWRGKFVFVRYNMDGSVDSSFGESGVTLVDLPDFSRLIGVGVQSDGRIVAAGMSGFGTFPPVRAIAFRLSAGGAIDSTFGNAGPIATDFSPTYSWQDTWTMVIQPDDKIVIGGYFATLPLPTGPNNPSDAGLIRLNSDGTLDNGFGNGGVAAFDFGGDRDEGYMGLVLLPDGKIVAVGETNIDGIKYTLIARHLANGSLDSTFGNGGGVITDAANTWLVDVIALPDGKLIALGGGGGNYVLQRYNPDGSFDSTFGIGGSVRGPSDFILEEGGDHNWFYSLARQPDGRLIVSGSAVTYAAYYNLCWCPVTFVSRHEGGGGTFQFSNPTYVSNESGISANVSVSRTGLVTETASVTFSTSNGTANAGPDYSSTTGTLNFDFGEVSKTFTIPILNDNVLEPDETVMITLSNPTNGATLGAQSTAVLTIVNDDKGASRTTVASASVTDASSVPLSASVSGSDTGAAICDGEVTFTVSKSGSVVGAFGPFACDGGTFSTTANLSSTGSGSYSVFASFDGGANHHPSSGTGSLAVGAGTILTPTIGSVSPASAAAGSGEVSISLFGSGFGGNSAVLWRDPVTLAKTGLSVTARSSTQLTATVPSTLLTRADAYQLTVDNTPANTTDGESGAQTFFVTAEPVAVTGVTSANPDPATNTAETATTGPAGTLSAEASARGGTAAAGTLTLAQYAADPVGESSGGSATTTFSSTGSYFDVHVSSGATYTTLSLNFCETGGTNLYWFDGNIWQPVTPQVYDSQTGCISVTLNNDPGNPSSPTISQLTGTVIAAAGGPEVKSIAVAPSGPQPLGSSVSLSAPFVDAMAGATHSAVIDWGDGTAPSTGSVSASIATGSHVYSAAGVYRVGVRITRNGDGAFGSAVYQQFVVIYDPKGGFATGGGWITSPLGAYAVNPWLVGRASFGFSSKYQKGATLPSGDTQFNFHTAGFDFRSTAYEWLVVSGARGQYKGTGRVNGAGTYGFILTAVDGQINGGGGTDKFRIKIWDTATAIVIYDNQRGADDTAAPAIGLGGGSIVIHK